MGSISARTTDYSTEPCNLKNSWLIETLIRRSPDCISSKCGLGASSLRTAWKPDTSADCLGHTLLPVNLDLKNTWRSKFYPKESKRKQLSGERTCKVHGNFSTLKQGLSLCLGWVLRLDLVVFCLVWLLVLFFLTLCFVLGYNRLMRLC